MAFTDWQGAVIGASAVLLLTAPMVWFSRKQVLKARWMTWLVLITLYAAASLAGRWATIAFMSLVLVICGVEFLRLPQTNGLFPLVWLAGGAAAAATNPVAGFQLFLIIAAFDVGGWLGGRALGRSGPGAKKIAPKISPNKTLAGLIAALLIGLLVTVVLKPAWAPFYPIIAVLALAGDLTESWIKRRAGVKDAGNWLPGFGGLLDRMDSFLAAAIVLWWLH